MTGGKKQKDDEQMKCELEKVKYFVKNTIGDVRGDKKVSFLYFHPS